MVVEIGCGTGRETKYLADCFFKVLAIDASKTMIEKAKKELRKEILHLKLQKVVRYHYLMKSQILFFLF
jgi:trans-aconitate methyltransferase